MKKLISISTSAILTFIVIFACGNNAEESLNQDQYNTESYYEASESMKDENQQAQSKQIKESNDKIVMKAFTDPKTGQVIQYMPLPQSWKITGSSISGPGNVHVQQTPYRSFNTYQYQAMSARQIASNILGVEVKNKGGRITKITDMPGIAKKNLDNLNQFYSSGGYNKYSDAVSVDIVDGKGNPNLVIVHQTYFDMGGVGMWGYAMHTMSSNKSVFDSAKKSLIYGLLNVQTDRNYIARANGRMQTETHNSWTNHNRRMQTKRAADDAAFQATQRAYTDATNSVSDIYMDTWKNTSAASDRMQSNSVQGIRGTETVQDPMYGDQYEVQSGYDRYFMNGSGEYIGTNDQFYQTGSDPYAAPDVREVYKRNN